jgi:hypothetical protein
MGNNKVMVIVSPARLTIALHSLGITKKCGQYARISAAHCVKSPSAALFFPSANSPAQLFSQSSRAVFLNRLFLFRSSLPQKHGVFR